MEQRLPVQDILAYWFGSALDDSAELDKQAKRWFNGGRELDHEIQVRFGELIKPLAREAISAIESSESALAAILLFDQFPRHVYRGQAQAFAFDDKARAILQLALQNQWHKQLHPVQQSFLYMPLQHAESLEQQDQAVTLYRQLVEDVEQEAPDPVQQFIAHGLEYAVTHRNIIAEFGRFPHRNRALGRTSSDAELTYLASAQRFGQ